MITETTFSAKITTYRNYLGGCENRTEPVEVVPKITLSHLLKLYYKNSGAFIYEINQYELEQ